MAHQQDDLTRLGFLGLAPFVFGAAFVWAGPLFLPQWIALNIHTLVLAYGGIIAAYMAGMGAGAGLKSQAPQPLLPGMIAALVAWFAIWPAGFLYFSVPAVWRYLILIVVFVWLLLRDLRAVAAGDFPSWYGALRTRLTFWTSISLVLIMARLISWRHF